LSRGTTKKIYPLSLLLENRPCLIIGGGAVAARKADGLLQAGARVTVISPDLHEHLSDLLAQGRIEHIARHYAAADLQDYALVFAATGQRATNRKILTTCRAQGRPCCPVDGNWMLGDFVTPAVLRREELTVAISTGGQSCRRSRLIRNHLARHLDEIAAADLCIIGTSHQELTLQQRDPFQWQGARYLAMGRMLKQVWGLHEFLLLNTCNRIELLAIKTQGDPTTEVLQRIMGFDALPEGAVYCKEGRAAFEHTALLAAGLLSQMTGENHIVAQLKAALAQASTNQWAGGTLHEWISAALHISKDIRQTLPRHRLTGEIEDAAVLYLQQYAKAGPPPRITVLGTGTVGAGVVDRLSRQDLPCHWLYHRQKPTRIPPGITLAPWRELPALLQTSDCVITATKAATPILTASMAPCFTRRQVLLLDLATPCNIDPALASDNVLRVDLDTLKQWLASRQTTSRELLASAQAILDRQQQRYDQIRQSLQG